MANNIDHIRERIEQIVKDQKEQFERIEKKTNEILYEIRDGYATKEYVVAEIKRVEDKICDGDKDGTSAWNTIVWGGRIVVGTIITALLGLIITIAKQ